MRIALFLLPIALLCSCASVRLRQESGQVVSLDGTHDETNRAMLFVSGRAPFTQVQVREDYEMEKEPGNFACFRVSLLNVQGQEIAAESYSAQYGIHVDAVDLDGDSIPEFILQTHVGPATGPAIKELAILRFRPLSDTDGYLETVVKMPCAGQAGPTVGWWYEVDYPSSSKGRGHDIRLMLKHDASDEWSQWLPSDRVRVISLRKGQSLIQFPGPAYAGTSNKTMEPTGATHPDDFRSGGPGRLAPAAHAQR